MICPNCGFDNLPGGEECASCGQDLTQLDRPVARDRVERSLMEDAVGALCNIRPLMIHPGATLQEAIAAMMGPGVGALLIVDDDGKLLGIFTERDLMRRVLAENKPLTQPVEQCMTPNPVTVHPKDPIGKAVRRMEEGGYRHLPVVDEAGRAIGVLSVKRIVHYLVEHFPTTIYNLPPDPGVVPQEREGA